MLGTYEKVIIKGSLSAFWTLNRIVGTPNTGLKNAVIIESEVQDNEPIFSPGSDELFTEADIE